MRVVLDRREAATGAFDAVVIGIGQGSGKTLTLPPGLAAENKLTDGHLERALMLGEFRARPKETATYLRGDGKGRVVVVGLGRTPASADTVREAVAAALKSLRGHGTRTAAIRVSTFLGGNVDSGAAVRALASGALLGTYQYLRFKSESEGDVEEVTLALGPDLAREEAALRRTLHEEVTLSECALFARDLANTPANIATPEWLAEEAVRLGKEVGLKVTVFDEKRLEEMHCGGLLAVGSGSSHPPRMVIAEYPGGTRRGKTVAVVGKGITFDSGGLSLKTAAGMTEMKFDKSGACAALGVARAAALLKLPPRVVAVMACAENLPSGTSYRPGDVLRTYNGKSIEVLDTDAEGRVALSDALAYVVDKYHPDEVIDLATLTGAVVIALGEHIAGMVSNNDVLADGLARAGAAVGEPLWRLPLTDPHREMVKSAVADIRNVVEPRIAGSLIGGAFLEHFVGDGPWAHLDIAGTAWTHTPTLKWAPAYHPLGATGFGVRLIGRYLLDSAR
jgi:leucyl aminopeptidase